MSNNNNSNIEDRRTNRITKERRIRYIIEKVAKWREYYKGIRIDGESKRFTLKDAVQKVNISNDYRFEMEKNSDQILINVKMKKLELYELLLETSQQYENADYLLEIQKYRQIGSQQQKSRYVDELIENIIDILTKELLDNKSREQDYQNQRIVVQNRRLSSHSLQSLINLCLSQNLKNMMTILITYIRNTRKNNKIID